jgi:hypothetical protein
VAHCRKARTQLVYGSLNTTKNRRHTLGPDHRDLQLICGIFHTKITTIYTIFFAICQAIDLWKTATLTEKSRNNG